MAHVGAIAVNHSEGAVHTAIVYSTLTHLSDKCNYFLTVQNSVFCYITQKMKNHYKNAKNNGHPCKLTVKR